MKMGINSIILGVVFVIISYMIYRSTEHMKVELLSSAIQEKKQQQLNCDDTSTGTHSCVDQRLNPSDDDTSDDSQCFHKCKQYKKVPNKHCGYVSSQLNDTRGTNLHDDYSHLHLATYDTSTYPDESKVSFCKRKCNRNPKCGSFVLNKKQNHCYINEKVNESQSHDDTICKEGDEYDTYLKPFSDCKHHGSNWYCEKEFGHRTWK